MKPLIIHKTDDSPEVVFDKDKGIFLLEGISLPEETVLFYDTLIKWLEEYSKNPNEETVFNFKINYYNSTSSIQFVRIFKILEKIQEQGKKVKVIWYYNKLDDTIKEDGEEFKKFFKVDFELKEI